MDLCQTERWVRDMHVDGSIRTPSALRVGRRAKVLTCFTATLLCTALRALLRSIRFSVSQNGVASRLHLSSPTKERHRGELEKVFQAFTTEPSTLLRKDSAFMRDEGCQTHVDTVGIDGI